MASQPKENWWSNIPILTQSMDLAIPALAQLQQTSKPKFTRTLHHYCEFLEQHPIAINHRKSKYALIAHMKLNIERYLQGLPFHH